MREHYRFGAIKHQSEIRRRKYLNWIKSHANPNGVLAANLSEQFGLSYSVARYVLETLVDKCLLEKNHVYGTGFGTCYYKIKDE